MSVLEKIPGSHATWLLNSIIQRARISQHFRDTIMKKHHRVGGFSSLSFRVFICYGIVYYIIMGACVKKISKEGDNGVRY